MRNCKPAIAFAFFFAVACALPSLYAQDAEPPTQRDQLWQEAQDAIGNANYDKAISVLEQMRVLEPEDQRVLLELARVHSWAARWDDSRRYYDLAVANDPADIDLQVERARVLGWQGDYPAAEAAVRQILEIEPENIDAALLLASILEWQERTEEAQEVYAWVLRIDPENESARSGKPTLEETETEAAAVHRETTLDWQVNHSGDNQDYFFLGTRLGLRFGVLPRTTLQPFVVGNAVADRHNDLLFGAGGGIGLDVRATETLTLGIEGGALVYPSLDNLVDWNAGVRASWTPWEWLYLAAQAHTTLYGLIGQSVDTLSGSLRAYGGTLSSYMGLDPFSMFAMYSVYGLLSDAYPTNLVSTLLLYPKIRVVGRETRFHLGYKLWYTGYTENAPTEYGYWSPAQYFTHQGMARLEGAVGAGEWYVEGGGGIGHEYKPATGVGTASENPADWVFFPAVVGGAGIRGPLANRVEAGLDGWVTYSQRELVGNELRYVLWHITGDLVVRW